MKVPRGLRVFVSPESLDAIAEAVRRAESRTSGEIVVHIVRNLLPLETSRKRAQRAFAELGVDQTAQRNGVLLLVVMKKRRFEIVPDEGIDSKAKPPPWEEIASSIAEGIRKDGLANGICAGVEQIGLVLAAHFPSSGTDANQLPDRPSVAPD
ncbi:MAG TPA: TPM domain-containing protein [Vicinamibacteria bacterium]|nr:TPM domain-containing protein [Vicinamibacteria bacterium]